MSEVPSTPSSEPPAASSPSPPQRSTWGYTLAVIVLLVAGAVGYYYYEKAQHPEPPPVDELKALREYFHRLASTQQLASEYTDVNPQDLVADTPTDPNRWVRVGEELTFTVVGTDDPTKAAEQWQDFMQALEKATGKKVVYLDSVRTIDDQLAAVREGRLHVTAFNTGAVPTAVNSAGFVPLFAPANDDGKYSYEMEILVAAAAPIQKPADLRGKRVGFVALSSNSGAKAPLLVLREEFELSPGHDYQFGFTGDHLRSVKELIAGKYDAVCVANDLLRRAEASGEVDKTKYRSIYTSQPFPPLCFGVPHHLPPEVQAQVKRAFMDYRFSARTAAGQRALAQGYTRFAPVNYAKDWEFVRKIDDTLTRLFDRETGAR
ncbi:MAG: phosphate/phosphite/phosphonate ABC transporter substrate-binding protein [Gemmataceae bacterium]|nr:phosphate/phosphite/phosphonate ABC transporter substrate-binding protein [Gemmata sp.]MDW8198391.1 phosphate/phosphite/phosphonate ABC transporter substrate-binding protein [Gemmataceae bacterium]